MGRRAFLTSIVMAGGTSWFSRTFGKASTKKGKATTGKEASETAVAEASVGATAAASAPEAVVASAASDTGKKMCVDDFEPLKLIGRGAFGACGFVSRRA